MCLFSCRMTDSVPGCLKKRDLKSTAALLSKHHPSLVDTPGRHRNKFTAVRLSGTPKIWKSSNQTQNSLDPDLLDSVILGLVQLDLERVRGAPQVVQFL